jgi:hypothetical protein
MVRTASVLAVSCALALAGCGSSASEANDPASVKSTYESIEQLLVKGDGAACDKLTSDYRNKLAASVQMFQADCPGVVKEVGRGLKEDPDLRTTRITDVKVAGDTASLVAHSKYNGRDVRTKVFFKRATSGGWLLTRDQELDEVAPSAPLAAYRAYAKAFNEGDGAAVCALSTEGGQDLIIQSVPRSHGGGTCKGAVPYLAAAIRGFPDADVVGGDQQPSEATIYTLQSSGSGSWIYRIVVMKKEDGKWHFDYSKDLGVAPPKSLKGGPVA